jgi:TolB-like protein
MSQETDNDYFSDGITEEILNALARVDGLTGYIKNVIFCFQRQKQ